MGAVPGRAGRRADGGFPGAAGTSVAFPALGSPHRPRRPGAGPAGPGTYGRAQPVQRRRALRVDRGRADGDAAEPGRDAGRHGCVLGAGRGPNRRARAAPGSGSPWRRRGLAGTGAARSRDGLRPAGPHRPVAGRSRHRGPDGPGPGRSRRSARTRARDGRPRREGTSAPGQLRRPAARRRHRARPVRGAPGLAPGGRTSLDVQWRAARAPAGRRGMALRGQRLHRRRPGRGGTRGDQPHRHPDRGDEASAGSGCSAGGRGGVPLRRQPLGRVGLGRGPAGSATAGGRPAVSPAGAGGAETAPEPAAAGEGAR